MKKLMSLFIIAGLAFACTDDDIRSEHVLDNGPKIVGFAKGVENIAYFEDLGVQEQNIQVSLLGLGDGNLSSAPIEVTYEVDLVRSTATENTEFNFADSTRKVTIPAGGSFVNLPILVNTGSLNPTQRTELYLNLTATNGGVVGEQYKTIKIIFVGCATDLAGTYTRGTKTATITKITPNTYHSTYFPAFAATYWFEFSDVCGELEFLDWEYQGGNPVTGADGESAPTGYVSQPSGNITFTNVNCAGVSWYVNLTWTLVKQ